MSDGIIQILCPEMLVENTSWRPRSDRRAVELPCPVRDETGKLVSFVQLTGEQPIEIRNFRFPSCRVYTIAIGRWMVEPVMAWGDDIFIQYPQEPIKRRGWLMIAQAIQNVVEESIVTIGGARYFIDAPLPEAIGRPGKFFGLFSYLVDAVTITGTISRV